MYTKIDVTHKIDFENQMMISMKLGKKSLAIFDMNLWKILWKRHVMHIHFKHNLSNSKWNNMHSCRRWNFASTWHYKNKIKMYRNDMKLKWLPSHDFSYVITKFKTTKLCQKILISINIAVINIVYQYEYWYILT